jgi:signal transduction histidine kinase
VLDAEHGLDGIARETCEIVCGVGRLASAAVAVLAPSHTEFQLLAACGEEAGELVAATLGAGGALTVLAAIDGLGFAESADGMLLAAAAPAGALSVLIVGRRQDDAWARDACLAQVLEGTARVAGVALRDRLQSAAEEHRRAARRRTELACTIHEDVVQRMFGVSLVLADAGPLDADLREICSGEIERALGDLRAIIRGPVSETPERAACLTQALDELAALGIAVDAAPDRLTADPDQQAIARSVLGEAVRNARKHAAPSRIQVIVREADGLLKLSVFNDGVRDERRRFTSRSGVGLQLAVTEAAHGGGVLEHGPDGPGRWAIRLALPLEERDEHDCHDGLHGGSGG